MIYRENLPLLGFKVRIVVSFYWTFRYCVCVSNFEYFKNIALLKLYRDDRS